MKGKVMMFLTYFILGISCAIAQTRTITGVVISSEDGQPIIGASVLVNGTSIGTATDIDGKFVLSGVPSTAKTLTVSYIGMRAENNVTVKSGLITITLVPDAIDIEDVIIVGYGTTRREAKTGSITTVVADKIAEIPAASVDKMLAGKMAGVMVTQSSGQPGSNSQIRIRGISSINASNEPLYVVDGIPVMSGDQSYFTNSNNAISMINPDDIESISVLKDAASASVYGSRAANGVILITTKSGKEGKSVINVRAKYGVSSLAHDNSDFGIMNSAELLSFQRQAAINAGYNPDDPTSLYYRPYELLSRQQTNWMNEFTRLGQLQEYEINLSGGNAKSTYYSSVSYHDNEGVFHGFGFKRFQARINADYEISNNWKTGVKINTGYMNTDDVPTQALYYANPAFAGMTILPWTPARNEDGSFNSDIDENANSNPRATAAYDDQWERQYRFNGTMYLEWKPIKGLTIKTSNAAEMTFNEGRRYWSLEANNYEDGYPVLQTSQMHYELLTTSNTAVYEGSLDKHHYRILAGQEANRYHYWYSYEMSENLNPDMPYHVSGNTSNDVAYEVNTETMMSFFGILDYNFDGKYYFQGSLRYDGDSKFGKDKKWGLFYSLGASWNIHNESFMEDVDWIDMLKLRVSYGLNGNNNISNYQAYGVYSASAYNGISTLIPDSPANDELSWEKNSAWNAGIDFHFLERINGSIDVYTRKTTDMLLWKSLPRESGFSSALQNIGSMRNTGIEFQMDVDIIQSKDWNWNVGFNISHNKSKILNLGDDEVLAYSENSYLKYIKGESVFSFWLRDYAGVNPVNGEALWRTEDGALSNNRNDAQYINAGSPEPKYTGGISTELSWKNITLSVVCEFKGGNKILIGENSYLMSDGNEMTMNQFTSALNYWTKPGDTGCNPKPIAGNATGSYSSASTRYLEKGDYFRIKDVTLSYNLPKGWLKKAGLGGLKLYASGLNVYTFHDVNFWDPERGIDGTGSGIYPVTKSFVVGLDLSF